MTGKFDLKEYAKIARQAAAEGCVLLKNDYQALPLREGDKVAVFGRCASYYYKSGLGSGGLVNTRYVVSILDALKACDSISLDENLLQIYEDWEKENPVDEGHGWGTVPWSQKEMPLTEEIVQAAKDADAAIVIVGRTAGEDQDNSATEGSYLLTPAEKDMIKKVANTFKRTIVLLNTGNIIDMKWVEEINPAAVMYVWQGGQEGGNGVVDVLTGKVNPCGKLTDTIAYDITDYPSTSHFGDKKKNYYIEDIYVGYRYFETFAKEKVQYPFGYGRSYTSFSLTARVKEIGKNGFKVHVAVTNTGKYVGKEVVQIYVKAPQGKLGKPERVLAGFIKTKEIKPGERTEYEITCPKTYFASYDDSGITGNKSCFLLEEGKYQVYAGSDVRSASFCGSFMQEEEVLEQLEEACAPVEAFERLKPVKNADGSYTESMESVPLAVLNPQNRLEEMREPEIAYMGNSGYKLADVLDNMITMDEFVAQLSDVDLMCLFHGEGMCSPKVTPGTAGAFGGVTENLKQFGIPVACCADGPSGIRMDCGTKAFSLPNGTAMGCTFNLQLNKELFCMLGMELRRNKVDTLLGPGMNIHRNPLNGRNFEYISEDPVLTGKIASMQLLGMHEQGVTGTIKHFTANNQEQDRIYVEAVVSERALREIYLKVFEMAVKEAGAKSIMTTYGPVNKIWTAGNFDLCTMILRKQWQYTGIVMTDWWATANWKDEDAQKTNRAPMVRAQNDIYMCCADAKEEMKLDNVKEKLNSGEITRSDLQRNAKNILKFLMESPAMLRMLGRIEDEDIAEEDADTLDKENLCHYQVEKNAKELLLEKEKLQFIQDEMQFGLEIAEEGEYSITLEVKSELEELAQLPVSVYIDNLYIGMFSFRGTRGKVEKQTMKLGYMKGRNHFIKLLRKGNGLDIETLLLQFSHPSK